MKTLVTKLQTTIKKIITQDFLVKKKIPVEIRERKDKTGLTTNVLFCLEPELKKTSKFNQETAVSWLKTKLLSERELGLEKIEKTEEKFLNFSFKESSLTKIIKKITLKKNDFFRVKPKKNIVFRVEVMSANPTGEMHIGNFRNGVKSDVVANCLELCGYHVIRDYYVNDDGEQVNKLALTVFLNYLSLFSKNNTCKQLNNGLNNDLYQGKSYKEIAVLIQKRWGDKFIKSNFTNIKINDEKVNNIFKEEAVSFFMKTIKRDLRKSKIKVDCFLSEKKISSSKQLKNKIITQYKKKKLLQEQDGSLFLKTTLKGDDKDRVLVKKNGKNTYFMNDIINHCFRFKKTKLMNKKTQVHFVHFWGADHHNYQKRLKIALEILNIKNFKVKIVQFVHIINSSEQKIVKVSKRQGTSFLISRAVDQFGTQTLRYFLAETVSNKKLELLPASLKEKSWKNPIFYLQYASVRLYQLLKKAEKKGLKPLTKNSYPHLKTELEKKLLIKLHLFWEIINRVIKTQETAPLCLYLKESVRIFHHYYATEKIINSSQQEKTKEKLSLLYSFLIILKKSLSLLGIKNLKKM